MDLNGIEFTEDMKWMMFAAAALSLLIRYFYCNTIRKTLLLVDEENRHMKPQQAWLALIPILNIYWNFKVAELLANSLTNEFYDRKIAEEENPGKSLGYTYAVIFAISSFPISSGIFLAFGIFSLIYYIRYWVKVAAFKTLLEEHNRVFNYLAQKEEKDEA